MKNHRSTQQGYKIFFQDYNLQVTHAHKKQTYLLFVNKQLGV